MVYLDKDEMNGSDSENETYTISSKSSEDESESPVAGKPKAPSKFDFNQMKSKIERR